MIFQFSILFSSFSSCSLCFNTFFLYPWPLTHSLHWSLGWWSLCIVVAVVVVVLIRIHIHKSTILFCILPCSFFLHFCCCCCCCWSRTTCEVSWSTNQPTDLPTDRPTLPTTLVCSIRPELMLLLLPLLFIHSWLEWGQAKKKEWS